MPAIATEPWCIERLDSFRCFLAARGRQATTTRGTRSSGIIEQQTNAPLIAEPTTRRSESRASERATAKQSETTGVQQKKTSDVHREQASKEERNKSAPARCLSSSVQSQESRQAREPKTACPRGPPPPTRSRSFQSPWRRRGRALANKPQACDLNVDASCRRRVGRFHFFFTLG